MALTVLQYANLVANRAGIIRSDWTALTSQSQQEDVDAFMSAINEFVDKMVFFSGAPRPVTVDTGSITLVTSDRSYAFASDFVALADEVLVDETNGNYLLPYPARNGRTPFQTLRLDQPEPANNTGLALYYAIDPETGELYLDAVPTANENGRVYKYLYTKETSFVTGSPSATFPFTDELLRQGIPAVIQIYNRDRRQSMYVANAMDESIAMAAALLSRQPTTNRRYGPDAARSL